MWTSLIQNPDAIRSIFECDPSLDAVRVMKVELFEDGPTLNISIVLNQYPDKPPLRWARIGANAVALVLQLMGVSHLSLDGWSTENTVACRLSRRNGYAYEVSVDGPTLKLSAVCQAARITHIEGYKQEKEGLNAAEIPPPGF